MAVALAKKVGDDTTIPYELTNATRLRLALVGQGTHVFAEDVQVSPLSSNTVTGMILGRDLLLGSYGLEVTFRDNGKDKRFFVDNMFTVVNELVEDSDDEAEGEGGGIEVTITVQPEDIDFSGAMGTPAGFGTPTIEVDANVGTPSAEITAEGPDTAKIFNFIFHNLKGEPGSDASVTAANIASALGYTPVSPAQLAAKTDVFWAIYGETTTEQIQVALSSRKTVLCQYGPIIYQFVYNGFLNDESSIFANIYNNDGVIQLATLIVGSDDTWSSRNYSLQESIADLSDIRSGAAAGATAYQKPGTGIPSSDMASAVQTSLGKADSAYQKPSGGIPGTDLASGVIPDVSNFITKSVNDLVNYYLKSDTYTKAEVQALIGAIQGFSYEVVSSLPTASASTMGKIYLVPSADPQTQNVKDEYITLESSGSYSWEQIGSTAIDLSGYVTTSQLNTALADYTTTADLTTLLAGKQATLTFDNAPTQNSDNPVKSGGIYTALSAKYEKPSGGIPSTDLASGVQTSLGKADSAYQKPGTGIPASDLASGVIPDVSGKEDKTNKVTSLSAQSTDTQYPSAKAVYDGLAEKYEKPSGGIPDTDLTSAVQALLGKTIASVSSPTPADGTILITLTNGDVYTLDLNHNHPAYYSKVAETTQPSGGFLPDVVYSLGTLTGAVTFALAAAVSGNVNHYFWMFDTGSTAPTVTWPSGITWADGSAPTVAASKHYEISVLGGIATYMEV